MGKVIDVLPTRKTETRSRGLSDEIFLTLGTLSSYASEMGIPDNT